MRLYPLILSIFVLSACDAGQKPAETSQPGLNAAIAESAVIADIEAAIIAQADNSATPADTVETAPQDTPDTQAQTPVGTDPEVGDALPNPPASGGKSLAQLALEEERRRKELEARGVKEIGWEDLMPEGEEERLAELFQAQMAMIYSQNIGEGSAGDNMVQIGTFNTVKELNGQKIRMAGYTVPFIFGKDDLVEEFLLVPYFGACLHAPPPPPNQTVFVRLNTPIKRGDLSQAVWVEGKLQTDTASTDLADAAYTLIADDVVKYTY